MSKFILIENTGVASPEAFTILGASNKAGTDAIGQFGSGTKFGTLTLLRKGINPTVFCGNLKLEFGTKPIQFEGVEQNRVYVRVTGKNTEGKQVNRTEDLSVVVNYGQIDWKDKIELALREFVSNALDAENGNASNVKISFVKSEPRAKAGTTRVFIPLTDEGENFVNNISKWFLHFNGKGEWRTTSVIEKDKPSPARIYRRGVLVREVENYGNSLFDYNLNDLPLDEARVANDWTVKNAAEKALNRVFNVNIIVKLLSAPENVWESRFDLTGRYDFNMTGNDKATSNKAWSDAQDATIDHKTIFADAHQDTTLAEGKGYKVVRLNSERYEVALAKGLRTINSILTTDERQGRRVDAVANPAALPAVKTVWDKLVALDATKGEQFPDVKTYTEHSTGNGVTLGLWKENTVYLNNQLLSGQEMSPELFAVCLEELAHHITKATDNSRGFQEFFVQLLTKVLQ